MSAPSISVHDAEFKHLVTLPLAAVHHLPPAHLEISRLVLCRKYDSRDPESCPMGDSCKFVHADLGVGGVVTQSIHVNYAWRSFEEVTFPHLPAGEMIPVMAPNNRAPSVLVPSELLIATKGALAYHEGRGPLSHCAHYYFNRMCNRGDRCNFVHAIYVDPTASEFQRAPPRAGGGYVNGATPAPGSAVTRALFPSRGFATHAAPAPASGFRPQPHESFPGAAPALPYSASWVDSADKSGSLAGPESDSSCDVSSCHSCEDESTGEPDDLHASCAKPIAELMMPTVTYRRNPYSLLQVTVEC